MRTSRMAALVALVSLQAAGGCRTTPSPSVPIVQPGAPGEPARTVAAAAATSAPRVTEADITFMQGMIHHHAQAVDMVDLLEARTTNDDMRKVGQRIELSQVDEIKMMQAWLAAHGQGIPTFAKATVGKPAATPMPDMPERAHQMASMQMMPGMLTPEQMDQLAAAKGPAFDRLFLQFMIQHHQGALTMVKDLFATPGAAQDPSVFAFASDVDADQRAEIARMSTMLKELHQ